MAKVLYIEDDPEIGSWARDDLERRGFDVCWLRSGDKAAEYVQQKDVDVVVLDVMLPGLDGFTVGRRLKKICPQTPILMLSARTTVEDKVEGLRFADDYLTKPFDPDELAARLEALLRRYAPTPKEIQIGHLAVKPEEHLIIDRDSGKEIILTGKQRQIFMFLLQRPNQILTKEQIFESVWGEPYLKGDKTLMVHIRHLREKLEKDPSNPTIIETIRGIGYRVKL